MIQVLAGVNGAGKSSVGGSAILAAGGNWYNPDAIAQEIHEHFPDRPIREVNSAVWHEGRRRLQAAIRDDSDFAFETTLGGTSITNTLLDAIAMGIKVNVWYCGLESPELHMERVAARVARGGHDIPQDLVRQRYRSSMRNLCRIALGLNRLAVYDNSLPLGADGKPRIRRVLDVYKGRVLELEAEMPDWAKPIATVVMSRR
ncbi:MAG: zeta toxin family protein [Gammaproteobacteria bacterium]